VESITISTNKSWNLSQLVDFEVVRRDALYRVGVNNLELDVVGLGDRFYGGRARVLLLDSVNHNGIWEGRS
jgi:hypothetical protein